MKRTGLLSMGLSLFCSAVLSNFVYDAGKGPFLAANPGSQQIQRGLQDLVTRMGGAGEVPVLMASAEGAPAIAPVSDEKQPLGALVDWIVSQGRDVEIGGGLGMALKLGDGKPLMTKQKVFSADKTRFVLSVYTTKAGKQAVIMVNRIAGDDPNAEKALQLFLTSRSGVIEKTLAGKGNDAEEVSDASLSESFESTKKFWLERVAATSVAKK